MFYEAGQGSPEAICCEARVACVGASRDVMCQLASLLASFEKRETFEPTSNDPRSETALWADQAIQSIDFFAAQRLYLGVPLAR